MCYFAHLAHLLSTKYKKSFGGGDSVVAVMFLQLTRPSVWLARNIAALVFSPAV